MTERNTNKTPRAGIIRRPHRVRRVDIQDGRSTVELPKFDPKKLFDDELASSEDESKG